MFTQYNGKSCPLDVIDIVFILLHLTQQLSALLFCSTNHLQTPPLPPPRSYTAE